MKSNLKNLYWGGGIVIVLAIILIVIFAGNPVVSKKETVKVGVTLPLTGDLATYGQGLKNGILLALNQVGNNTKYNYDVIFEDDAYDSSKVATNVQKFINVDGVDAVISFSSASGNVAAPIAEQNKVLSFSTSASDLTVAKGNFDFDQTTTPQAEAKKMVEELQVKGIKKVAVAMVNIQAFQAIYSALEEDIKGTGIEIVDTEKFNSGETNFKTGILKIEDSKPDIYLVLMLSPEVELFKKQADEQGVATNMTSIESFDLTKEKNLFEGMWYIGVGSDSETYTGAYKSTYGSEPTAYSADAYTNMKLIISTYESTKNKLSPEEMVPKLLAVKDFDGGSGLISSDANGVFSPPATLRKIVDGKVIIQ